MGHVGAEVHQFPNRPAGAGHRQVFKQLAHLEEEHNRHRFSIVPGKKRADGGDAHQEVFVEYLAVADVFQRAP